MGRKKVTRITLETERLLVIHSPDPAVERWCEQCGGMALLITPEEAAFRSGLSRRAIYRMVEAGGFHLLEPSSGTLFICVKSLLSGS